MCDITKMCGETLPWFGGLKNVSIDGSIYVQNICTLNWAIDILFLSFIELIAKSKLINTKNNGYNDKECIKLK